MNYRRSNTRPAHLVIDQAALSHNLCRVREIAPDSRIMAVIKADGYGHSIVDVAKTLDSADEFAVTDLDDVAILRGHGITKPTTILSSSFDLDDLKLMSANSVRPVLFGHHQIDLVKQLDSSAKLDVWLKIDTGMGRLGFSLEDAHQFAQGLIDQQGVRSVSLMTHLANADQPDHASNRTQFKAFREFANDYPFASLSILNSAGIVGFNEYALDVVRPGIMLYGVSPQLARSAESLGLKPVMSFRSELISVKRLPAGSPIGYGSTYTLDSDTRIGVIACGYADGFPRHAPSGTLVFVNGLYVPIIGRVSMDMITVDLGEMPSEVGDLVTLWGVDNPVENIAEACGTIAYELLCGITARVERIFI